MPVCAACNATWCILLGGSTSEQNTAEMATAIDRAIAQCTHALANTMQSNLQVPNSVQGLCKALSFLGTAAPDDGKHSRITIDNDAVQSVVLPALTWPSCVPHALKLIEYVDVQHLRPLLAHGLLQRLAELIVVHNNTSCETPITTLHAAVAATSKLLEQGSSGLVHTSCSNGVAHALVDLLQKSTNVWLQMLVCERFVYSTRQCTPHGGCCTHTTHCTRHGGCCTHTQSPHPTHRRLQKPSLPYNATHSNASPTYAPPSNPSILIIPQSPPSPPRSPPLQHCSAYCGSVAWMTITCRCSMRQWGCWRPLQGWALCRHSW